MIDYIPETKLSESEIRAGLDNGTLEIWRIDGNGVWWLKRMPPIHGVPKDETLEAVEDFDDV